MATTLQHRRGTTACAAGLTLAAGEFFVDCQTNKLYLHDGSTQGGVLVGALTETSLQDNALNIKTGTHAGQCLGLMSSSNVAIGYNAMCVADSASHNVAIGNGALQAITNSSSNIAIGFDSQFSNKDGSGNIAIGCYALKNNTGGSNNTVIGNTSGGTSPVGNIEIGRLNGGSIACNEGKFVCATSSTPNDGTNYYGTKFNVTNAGAGSYCDGWIGTVELIPISGTTPSVNPCVGIYFDGCNGVCANAVYFNSISPGAGVALDTVFCVSEACAPTYKGCQPALLKATALDTGTFNITLGQCNYQNTNNAAFNITIGTANLPISSKVQMRNIIIGDQNYQCSFVGDMACHIVVGTGNFTCYKSNGTYTPNIVYGHSNLITMNCGGGENIVIGTGNATGICSGDGNVMIGNWGVAQGACYGCFQAEGCVRDSVHIGNYAAQKGGKDNVIIGANSGCYLGGTGNTIIGACAAGYAYGYGCNNTFLGYQADRYSAFCNRVIIGNSSVDCFQMNVQSISALSDARDKKNIESLPINGLELVEKLNPVKFTWNTRDGAKVDKDDMGFIAQEVLAVTEEYGVSEWVDLVGHDNDETLDLKMSRMIPLMVKAIQQLSEQNKELSAKVDALSK